MYLSEIAPISLRGLCGVFNQLSTTFGVFISEIIGLGQVLGREDTWQFALGIYHSVVINWRNFCCLLLSSAYLFVLLLYVPSQQLWSWRDGQFT